MAEPVEKTEILERASVKPRTSLVTLDKRSNNKVQVFIRSGTLPVPQETTTFGLELMFFIAATFFLVNIITTAFLLTSTCGTCPTARENTTIGKKEREELPMFLPKSFYVVAIFSPRPTEFFNKTHDTWNSIDFNEEGELHVKLMVDVPTEYVLNIVVFGLSIGWIQ